MRSPLPAYGHSDSPACSGSLAVGAHGLLAPPLPSSTRLERWSLTQAWPQGRGYGSSAGADEVGCQVSSGGATALSVGLCPGRNLRARHQSQGDEEGRTSAFDTERRATTASLGTGGSIEPFLQAFVLHRPPSENPRGAAERRHGAVEHLTALIASCCERLWIAESARHATPAVMLDLSGWMPGCTVEVARRQGQLQVRLRGVDPCRRGEVGAGLPRLEEVLAERMGYRIVVSVEETAA